jgi:hypothetical protein
MAGIQVKFWIQDELGMVPTNYNVRYSALKMKMLVPTYHTTRCGNPEDHNVNLVGCLVFIVLHFDN